MFKHIKQVFLTMSISIHTVWTVLARAVAVEATCGRVVPDKVHESRLSFRFRCGVFHCIPVHRNHTVSNQQRECQIDLAWPQTPVQLRDLLREREREREVYR